MNTLDHGKDNTEKKIKHSHQTVGKESINESKQKEILTCFWKERQLSNLKERIDALKAL